MGTVCCAGADRGEGSLVPSGSARSVVYLERDPRHAVIAEVSDRLGQNGRLDALAVTPHGASGLREHVKYLALSLLTDAPPRTAFRCSSPPRDPSPLA